MVGLTACTSSHHTTATSNTTLPAVTLPKGVNNATDVPTSVPNNPALRAHVQITKCAASADGWQASGDATNPGTGPVDYTITVFFTTSAATVIGYGSAKVHVAAGGHQAWSVSATFTPAPGTQCVLRGVG